VRGKEELREGETVKHREREAESDRERERAGGG
jgi:hypothetical protein